MFRLAFITLSTEVSIYYFKNKRLYFFEKYTFDIWNPLKHMLLRLQIYI